MVRRIINVRSSFVRMKIRLLVIIILSVFSCSVFAQGMDDKEDINSLLKKLTLQNADTALADIYARLCFRYCTSNPDSALWYGNKAMELSTKINYAKGIADAYNNSGWAYYSKGNLAKAKEYISEALNRFKKIGIKQYIAVSLSNLGNIYVD
jgi:tetratricopeptide (TPR) repeat protein